jgi:L-threonylcarbamoyladenylate synthase
MNEKKTTLLKIDALAPEPEKIAAAADFIKRGKTVVFPTETVYGLGANALDGVACAEIFRIKERPQDNPLIVHVSSLEMAERFGVIPSKYHEKIKHIWPSPITFIAEAKEKLPPQVTAGLDTVALRMPAHPVALSLITKAGCPIAAPSANPSRKPSAANAVTAIKYLDGKVDCIIDSGAAFFGLESTIIDLRDFTILRPGPFSPDEIEKVFGEKPKVGDIARGLKTEGIPVSPGTKYRHYSPETPLMLFAGEDESLLDIINEFDDLPPFAFIGSAETCSVASAELGASTVSLGHRADPYEIAKNLYDALILVDSLGVGFGVVENFEEKGIGLAIMNRLRKACGGREFKNAADFRKYLDGIFQQ